MMAATAAYAQGDIFGSQSPRLWYTKWQHTHG